jgi:tryptophan 7-halogenase
MENRNIRSVAIVGAGVPGWMSAAFLANMLGPSVSITLIDLGDQNETLFDEASLPPLKAFHQNLGINEADVIAKTQGSMKLGTQLVNWGSLGNRYFHPHGAYGAEFDAVPLHQWWLKSRAENPDTPELQDLSMAWALARENRFTVPVPDRRLIQSTFDYAYHMDSALYAAYLRAYATSRQVKVVQGDLVDVGIDKDTGFVADLKLSNDASVAADLFIDCTGQKSRLIQGALKASYQDWSSYLPCDRAISVSCAKGGEFTPYSRVTARDAGWQWRIPLQHRTSTGYVFATALMSDDDAIGSLMDNLDGPALGEPVVTAFKNGRLDKAFHKNVVALGGAAGFLEPLEATSLHLIQSGLTRLLALWPTRDCDPIVVNEYNKVTATEWDLARDFLVLHYKATSRSDAPLWRTCKDMPIPDGLQSRLDHWTSFGRLISPQAEIFQSASWLSVLVGQGIVPSTGDPLADCRADGVDYQSRILGLGRVIQETTTQMPLHREWIDKQARGLRA